MGSFPYTGVELQTSGWVYRRVRLMVYVVRRTSSSSIYRGFHNCSRRLLRPQGTKMRDNLIMQPFVGLFSSFHFSSSCSCCWCSYIVKLVPADVRLIITFAGGTSLVRISVRAYRHVTSSEPSPVAEVRERETKRDDNRHGARTCMRDNTQGMTRGGGAGGGGYSLDACLT